MLENNYYRELSFPFDLELQNFPPIAGVRTLVEEKKKQVQISADVNSPVIYLEDNKTDNTNHPEIGVPDDLVSSNLLTDLGAKLPLKLGMYPYPKENLGMMFRQAIFHLGLNITFSEIFYTPIGGRIPIHIDDDHYSNMTKLNVCISSANSLMTWFEPLPEFRNKSPYRTPLNTQYLGFKPNEVKPLVSKCMAGIYLINAGIPHGIDNPEDATLDRWTMSLTLGKPPSNKLQFEEAVNIFHDYIVT